MLAYTYPLADLFGTMLGLFIFIIWFWLLIVIFGDIFRSHDMGGGAKALWVIFVIVLPFLGIFVYLIARGGKMHERAAAQAQQATAGLRQLCQRGRRLELDGRSAEQAGRLEGSGHHQPGRVRRPKGQDPGLVASAATEFPGCPRSATLPTVTPVMCDRAYPFARRSENSGVRSS